MSNLELIDVRHEVRHQGTRIEQHFTRELVETRIELMKEIFNLRRDISELKIELHRALRVRQ